jgi:transposase
MSRWWTTAGRWVRRRRFVGMTPDQVLLMAPVLREWIVEGDLARFVSDLVESGTLEFGAIYECCEQERGFPPYDPRFFPPYDPRLMVKLLSYGYANAVMSSRELERATFRDVVVRMLCVDQHPDCRSIAWFRQRRFASQPRREPVATHAPRADTASAITPPAGERR